MVNKLQENLENMENVLNEYKKREIFSEKEIKRIIDTRKKYEMKLLRKNKNLDDFLNYIKSENKLLKIRNKRKKYSEKKKFGLDFHLENNLLRIYLKTFSYFDDFNLIKNFTEFCIKNNFIDQMKDQLSKLILKNIKNQNLWIYTANQLFLLNDIDNCRNTFIKGINLFNNNKMYIEFFKVECLYAKKIIDINKEMNINKEDYDNLEKGDVALTIFSEFYKKANKEEIDECLNISLKVDGLKEKIKNIIKYY